MLALAGKKIAVVGLGKTGQSCVRFLLQKGAQVTGFDTREHLDVETGIPLFLGTLAEDALTAFDAVLLSPGLPLSMPAVQRAKALEIPVLGDVELFAQNNQSPVVAVTGSNGKSTVVSMLLHVLKTAGVDAVAGGNIGTPVLDLLQKTWQAVVLELSSFQLETTHSLGLDAACILNVSEDHMDRYATFKDYCAAKQRIYAHAKTCIANTDDANTLMGATGKICTISAVSRPKGFGVMASPNAIAEDGKLYLLADELAVKGQHNLVNAQAVVLLARELGLQDAQILPGLKSFSGLPHRCQQIADKRGIRWINDSKATNVGATIAAIKGIRPSTKGRLILLAGGDSKAADLSPLCPVLAKDVDQLITLGKDGHLLARLKPNTQNAGSMHEAVALAANTAHSGDTVILSPACASLDMFASFEERGRYFTEAVRALP